MPNLKKPRRKPPRPKKLTKTRKTDSKRQYSQFLKSAYWLTVRAAVIQRDGHRCQMCGISKRLEVHHKTYAHHGQEHAHLGDLTTLCRSCHKALHKNKRVSVTTN